MRTPGVVGTYALVLTSSGDRTAPIGCLGLSRRQRGFYIYVESALGPGGLRERLLRHSVRVKKLRWHIDYLCRVTDLHAIWWVEDSVVREHQWAAAYANLPHVSIPMPRFGASTAR